MVESEQAEMYQGFTKFSQKFDNLDLLTWELSIITIKMDLVRIVARRRRGQQQKEDYTSELN